MSAMTDTKGGFLTAEDDPHNFAFSAKKTKEEETRPQHMTVQEWERMQLIKNLQRNKNGPFEPGVNAYDEEQNRKKCKECNSLEIDWLWDEVFHVRLCNKCKEKHPEKYSLLTKTECKQDYLLTERESAPTFVACVFPKTNLDKLSFAIRSCYRTSTNPTRTSLIGTT